MDLQSEKYFCPGKKVFDWTNFTYSEIISKAVELAKLGTVMIKKKNKGKNMNKITCTN